MAGLTDQLIRRIGEVSGQGVIPPALGARGRFQEAECLGGTSVRKCGK